MPEAGLCKPLQTAYNLCCLPSPATLMPEAALCRWENPLIGWTSTADPVDTVARSGLEFGSREAAIAFADKHGCALASGWTSHCGSWLASRTPFITFVGGHAQT